MCIDFLIQISRLEGGLSKSNISDGVSTESPSRSILISGDCEKGIVGGYIRTLVVAPSRAILIAGGCGIGLVRRYIRTLVVTSTGLLHHRKYIIPLRKAKATVTSSISVIVKPWTFLEMHLAINHVVCTTTNAFDRPSLLLRSWISFSETFVLTYPT